MEIPKPEEQPENIQPQLNHNNNTLSPSSSGRNNGLLNSPEFEFWMVSNPSFPQPNLHSADELFVDGIILPLCLLSHDEQQHSSEQTPQRNLDDEEEVNENPISEQGLKSEPENEPSREIGTQPGSGPESSSAAASTTVFSSSKRWRDIFKVGEKKSINNNSNNQEESKPGVEKSEKRKDRKSSSANNTSSTASGTNNSAELNINIWPFSRSRSAGNNNVNRPKVPLTRKVSSAPCSRSNSGSESKSRKWPSSPSRGGGIHLGRSSPVWQVRRGLNTASTASTTGMNKNSSEVVVKNADIKVSNVKKEGNADNKVKKEGSESSRWSKSRLGGGSGGGGSSGGGVVSGLNLNVQMCMGYRQNSICRSDEHRSSLLVNGGDQNCSGGAASNGGNGVKMFNIRTLFSSKKVY
ncbi:hypothetical protein C5167_019070 [Papaver somniferum]|uniref:Uncharacterized protein n=1 Tax=Papaver somniferum TaxID=3469 RepID=A0A4Y7ISE6_PAPSO|nr:homeobox protein Wariai-like [Papaver somniferum]RZC50641.1 hypothetical protein C5167_019070 [Papaver somniferum]